MSNFPQFNSNHHSQENMQSSAAFDEIWKSIEKTKTSNYIPPYVHPLTKKSTSSLNSKSLELCTESLGSETGSDGFSFFSSSSSSSYLSDQNSNSATSSDRVEVDVKRIVPLQKQNDTITTTTTTTTTVKSKSSKERLPIPPPLTTLVNRESSIRHLQMKSHRKDGRLVVEAVSVQTHRSYFHAERHDGRLKLLAISHNNINTNASTIDHDDKNQSSSEIDNSSSSAIVIPVTSNNDDRSFIKPITINSYTHNKFIGMTRNFNNTQLSPRTNHIKAAEEDNNNNINSSPFSASHRPPRPPTSRLTNITAQTTEFAGTFNSYVYNWRTNYDMRRHITSATAAVKEIIVYADDSNKLINDKEGTGISQTGNSSINKEVNNKRVASYPNTRGGYWQPAAPATMTVTSGCGRRRRESVWESNCCIATS